ncbi:E3 ubiquitin-protein ligase KCMF1-like isoform X2 [Gigantopelta aegis]|uniref:E3 ubiquitin-protein ligase KCMF1-like isoform X2 n=1 Tax=Gigantopelta aegis TaxID=1735272 RepID=UPI001B888F38|nr:E3 ubiquitin-protein ligase KCMF1-like isoform X2 [Gigantopelta aegis]
MSRHEGVSCDSCLKGNFRGRRYKCLICYDYDLCSTCYEAGATTTRHTPDHPVQCILTRTDFDIYYGVEVLTPEQTQSFTCPFCSKMGYTETTLHDHVTAEHAETSVEVVCPVCASLPGGDPNLVTDDFASHLTLEHRTPRDFDEPSGMRHVRRIPHSGRGVSGSRTRRANMHFASTGTTLTGLSPSGRETMDPIAELLSQLSSVRSRAAAAQSVSSQLQQLEMQLQSTRQQLERLPRRQAESAKTAVTANNQNANTDSANSKNNSMFLLVKCSDEASETEQHSIDVNPKERSIFVQELLLSSLTDQLQLQADAEDPSSLLEALKSPSTDKETGDSKPSVDRKMLENTQSKPVMPSSSAVPKTAERANVSPASSPRALPTGGQAPKQSTPVPQAMNTRQVFNAVPVSSIPVSSNNSIAAASSVLQVPSRNASGHTRDRDRDPRMNPAAAKRNLLKHMPAPRTSDTEPPPH